MATSLSCKSGAETWGKDSVAGRRIGCEVGRLLGCWRLLWGLRNGHGFEKGLKGETTRWSCAAGIGEVDFGEVIVLETG
jgi:hypothetical protein